MMFDSTMHDNNESRPRSRRSRKSFADVDYPEALRRARVMIPFLNRFTGFRCRDSAATASAAA
jgi:hypothetical protein